MNKTVKRALLIAGGVAAACGIVWGGLTLARNAHRGNVDVYAVSDFAMTDYWGDTSQTSGQVSTDKMQKIYLSDTQKVSKVYVEEGQTVKKGDKLLSYDTTLTSLDIERAEIAYEKQKLAQEDAKKDLERLMLAQDQESVDKKVAELQKQIDDLVLKNQQNWYDANSPKIGLLKDLDKDEKATYLKDPLGDGTESDGSKEKPFYYNWNTENTLSEQNLRKLLQGDMKEAYVVLVIRQENRVMHQVTACIGLRLVLESTGEQPSQPTEPVQPPEPTNPTEPTEPAEPAEPVQPTDPAGEDVSHQTNSGNETPVVTATPKLDYFYEDLPGITQPEPDGVNDEVRKLQTEIDKLLEAVAYPRAERIKMIREKNQEIAELDVTIKLAAVNLEKTKKEVGSDTVYSELDGTIKAVRDSNSAEFDKTTAVVEVSGGGGYYIDGALSELELGTVSIGETVQVSSWMTGTSAEGEIVEISDYPTDNANSWSDGNSNVSYYPFKVFVSEEADLREGDYVDMSYQNSTGSADGNTLYLESMFIRTENGKSYVMVRGENGKLEQRWVQTGRNLWGSYTQIRGGLTVDDFVAFPYGRDVVAGAGTTEATPDQLYNGM